jgi:hypothetical protein
MIFKIYPFGTVCLPQLSTLGLRWLVESDHGLELEARSTPVANNSLHVTDGS